MRKNDIQKIMSIDEEIVELVKKRSKLLSHIRVKGYVPSEVEKSLRQHWERYASEKTKDTSFVRTLFKILQQVEMQECGDLTPGRFVLSPSKKPIQASIEGTISEELVHLVLLCSAIARQPVCLTHAVISDYVFATIKMLQSVGVGIRWEHDTITTYSFDINVNDIVVHLAESEISLYALLAFSIMHVGHIKCVGGLSLSMLSLTLCKEVLVQCGVRLTSLGGMSGIPARIESTCQIPSHIDIPVNLPKGMVLTLCAVFSVCGVKNSICLQNHDDKDEILQTLEQLYTCLGIPYLVQDYTLVFKNTSIDIVEQPCIPLDPYHVFLRASIIYFTGGSLRILGNIPSKGIYNQIFNVLEQCGLTVQHIENGIEVRQCKEFMLQNYTQLPSSYFPILFTMYIASVREQKNAEFVNLPEGIEITEVHSFLEALGIEEKDGYLYLNKEQSGLPWIAPQGYWIIGYAYAGFLFSGLMLANPSDVTMVFPNFWRLYNNLPNMIELETPVLEEATPTKRRIIVR